MQADPEMLGRRLAVKPPVLRRLRRAHVRRQSLGQLGEVAGSEFVEERTREAAHQVQLTASGRLRTAPRPPPTRPGSRPRDLHPDRRRPPNPRASRSASYPGSPSWWRARTERRWRPCDGRSAPQPDHRPRQRASCTAYFPRALRSGVNATAGWSQDCSPYTRSRSLATQTRNTATTWLTPCGVSRVLSRFPLKQSNVASSRC